MVGLTKTIRIPLHEPNKGKYDSLINTLNRYSECINFHLDGAFLYADSKEELHELCYHSSRLDGLSANLVQSARDRALEMYWKGCTHTSNVPLRLNQRIFKLVLRDDTLNLIGITTINGRIYVPLPPYLRPYQKRHLKDITSGKATCNSAELVDREGDLWIHLFVKYELDKPQYQPMTIIGVDLGVSKLATVSVLSKDAVSKVNFFDGSELRFRRKCYKRSLSEWQSNGNDAMVRRSKGKISNLSTHLNHCISKWIVSLAKQYSDPVIVIESLKGIRERIKYSKRMNAELHSWSFAQLQSFIEYKALEKGIRVEYVDAKNTSRMCCNCGHSHKSNRRDQAHFKCLECGYEANSDFNASVNIVKVFREKAPTQPTWLGGRGELNRP
ncbi:MAG: transposase [Candidatus Altiarchaeales archaeon]|nr:transposase [Candidatus Altiarchaeales archaeon]